MRLYEAVAVEPTPDNVRDTIMLSLVCLTTITKDTSQRSIGLTDAIEGHPTDDAGAEG